MWSRRDLNFQPRFSSARRQPNVPHCDFVTGLVSSQPKSLRRPNAVSRLQLIDNGETEPFRAQPLPSSQVVIPPKTPREGRRFWKAEIALFRSALAKAFDHPRPHATGQSNPGRGHRPIEFRGFRSGAMQATRECRDRCRKNRGCAGGGYNPMRFFHLNSPPLNALALDARKLFPDKAPYFFEGHCRAPV